MALIRLKRFVVTCLIISILFLVYVLLCQAISERGIDLPYRNLMPRDYMTAIHKLQNSYNECEKPKTKEEYRKFIENDLGMHFYIYSERDMNDYAGVTFIPIRLIVLDLELDGYKYCETFVHEAIHLKEFVGQEDYVCFETFKYLYESEELHNVGVWYGLSQIYGCYSGEHDISHLIVDYLTKE